MDQISTPFDDLIEDTKPHIDITTKPETVENQPPLTEEQKLEEKQKINEMYEQTVNQLESIRQDQTVHPLITSNMDFALLLHEFEGANNFIDKINVSIF